MPRCLRMTLILPPVKFETLDNQQYVCKLVLHGILQQEDQAVFLHARNVNISATKSTVSIFTTGSTEMRTELKVQVE